MLESLSVFVSFHEGFIASPLAHARQHGFGFSKAAGMALEGPTETDPDAVFAAGGALFHHGLIDGDVTRLASLPAGDVRAVTDSARDASGALIAVILTIVVEGKDDLIAAVPGGSEGQYLLCTRCKEGEAWNVSEPRENRDACLGVKGAGVVQKSRKSRWRRRTSGYNTFAWIVSRRFERPRMGLLLWSPCLPS
mmetsp:Transcript_19620/g.48913  ORF Transcript_19620/g.48913 Transcript_19620/m.48913 type:complete len:194 (-) Transcript_19620:332-913(-)